MTELDVQIQSNLDIRWSVKAIVIGLVFKYFWFRFVNY